MRNAQLNDVKEFLKRAFSTRDSYGVFSKLPEGLAETYFKHCELIEAIVLGKEQVAETSDKEKLDRIIENLEANLKDILSCISSLTDRSVIAYSTEEGDTLWKISKRYAAELNEILKLNKLESIILPLGRIRLLIPLKNTAVK
jgi:hypothetical protein